MIPAEGVVSVNGAFPVVVFLGAVVSLAALDDASGQPLIHLFILRDQGIYDYSTYTFLFTRPYRPTPLSLVPILPPCNPGR